MVEDQVNEIEAFKDFAEWARKRGAAQVRNAHLEVTFFNDPRIFMDGNTSATVPLTDEEMAAKEKARQDARKFRSA